MDRLTIQTDFAHGKLLAQDLAAQVRSVLEHAVDAKRDRNKVYESLQNLNEVIGTEYGDRVLYELIQNAHDAHRSGDEGRIAIKLVVTSAVDGVLYIANGGRGFSKEDVEAIRNLATSAKDIGEGIGNKGLGFRSIEALTEDVRIYSSSGKCPVDSFDGYCFRFAKTDEIEVLLQSYGVEASVSREVARTVPRYLVPIPLEDQPEDIMTYARHGYATVIVAPLCTAEAVALAMTQVEELANLDVPLLLFLDRISEVLIDVEKSNQKPCRYRLNKRQTHLGEFSSHGKTWMSEVDMGEGRRFLVVRREVDKERVRAAVVKSIPKAPQLKRWLNWKGQPIVSVAVSLSSTAVSKGRLYNFLPMSEEAVSPLMGYLDAPFFADIDRRNAKLDLPLNNTLMEVAAEASALAALSIVEQEMALPAHVVLDLFAWTGPEAGKLDKALQEAGSSLSKARVIPIIPVGGTGAWSSLSEASIWPTGTFSVLKDRDVAKHIGAHLISMDLDSNRIAWLHEVARRISRTLSPTGQRLAIWSEAFACTLRERRVAPRTWSRFYEDLNRVFKAAGASLNALDGKVILYDRSGRLRAAGSHEDTTHTGVFVRNDIPKGRRTKGGVPFPPSSLARRYRFLDEEITLHRETLAAFINAGLVREYDPVAALATLKSAQGKNPNDNRRREALLWAFQMWRTTGERIEEELQNADLHVQTQTGWKPATQAVFSASWTAVGRTLEKFLVKAAECSTDCSRAMGQLLIPFDAWPNVSGDTKGQWRRFLELIGVFDGLRPVAAQIPSRGSPAIAWTELLRKGKAGEGLDGFWCAEVKPISFYHPYTEDYTIKGRAWRLPGQLEHDDMPETEKEAFCSLVFEHLKGHGASFFQFEVGRFGRYQRDWDAKVLPTPLATFLRSRQWIAASTQDGLAFRKPSECWAARVSVRRGGPPRFIDRLSEHLSDLSESEELATLLFGAMVGLCDWKNPVTAIDRLRVLASVVEGLASTDRPAFRREYQRAWMEVIETGGLLPNGLSLAVNRRGQFEELVGDSDAPPNVIVTQDAQRFEARALATAGIAVLEVGEISTKKVRERLDTIGTFVPRCIDGVGVRLLVDGEDFVPRVDDPLLTSLDLSWLPEVALLGHELCGEQLERGIQTATVDRRVRSIRVRRCEAISLVVEEDGVELGDQLAWYAVDDETLPTLILTNSVSLNWPTLAGSLATDLSRLIDRRLRSLKPVLLQLGLDRLSDRLDAPSDDALARALECDVQTVRDHRDALRTDYGHVLHLLVPVVGYFKGVELAQQLKDDTELGGIKFDIVGWLQSNWAASEMQAKDLIDVCEHTADRTALRRQLKLDYERFNRVLLELGEPALSNEAELRQLYAAYLNPMRSAIIDRLRRRHISDYLEGNDLSKYGNRKTLAFLSFDPSWVLTRETLESEVVKIHVSKLLDEELGPDRTLKLPSLMGLIEGNRKVVREFAAQASPVLRAWCHRNRVPVPEPWHLEEPQAVFRQLENAGLLDFEPIGVEQVVSLCRRAGIWPDEMPLALDRIVLGLDVNEVEEEIKRRELERHQQDVERRSIDFAGHQLDTGASSFAGLLQQLAEQFIVGDDWYERSRQRTKLVEFEPSDHHGGSGQGGNKKGGPRRRERQLTDTQRQAMGLASEWLAYHYLRRRHGEAVDETCWVSENRAQFFGGSAGDDSCGYDFLVKTAQAEWLYEVKSTLEDSAEFEMTANEVRVASGAAKDGRRRYRILYVPFVFIPERWHVLELPNPMGETTRNRFTVVGRGSVRLKFERG